MGRTTNTMASRRTFLRGMLTLGGAAAVLGGTRGGRAARAGGPRAPDATSPEGSSYRLTPHVRKYYETAAR